MEFNGLSVFNFDKLTKDLKDLFDEKAKALDVSDEEMLDKNNAATASNALDIMQPFYEKYRNFLEHQREMDIQNAGNDRRNAFQNIMSGANSAGMMYSNFPERSKYQYDTSTYKPAVIKAQNTYQTGLDTLRSNVVKAMNSLADYDAEIASLNKQYSNKNNEGLPTGAYALNKSGDYMKRRATDDGTNFFNSAGEPVRFGTTLRRSGITGTEGILETAYYVLDENAGNWLKDIYNKARSNGYGNVVINAGDDFAPSNLNFLSDSEKAFMDSLGLNFAQ